MKENKIQETCIAWFKNCWWNWEAELEDRETESSCTASLYKWQLALFYFCAKGSVQTKLYTGEP